MSKQNLGWSDIVSDSFLKLYWTLHYSTWHRLHLWSYSTWISWILVCDRFLWAVITGTTEDCSAFTKDNIIPWNKWCQLGSLTHLIYLRRFQVTLSSKDHLIATSQMFGFDNLSCFSIPCHSTGAIEQNLMSSSLLLRTDTSKINLDSPKAVKASLSALQSISNCSAEKEQRYMDLR